MSSRGADSRELNSPESAKLWVCRAPGEVCMASGVLGMRAIQAPGGKLLAEDCLRQRGRLPRALLELLVLVFSPGNNLTLYTGNFSSPSKVLWERLPSELSSKSHREVGMEWVFTSVTLEENL
ncbi:Hypothetical predicted protein [Marmota monax]|uniref:Uncharacterized protein n=1 Tax=Marmota monax TaxID=9995 RepID=A0A5E4AGE6_MARMO|nr:hypothetical protein GHT09_020346 [Marmota monax]VTJ56513.1 Hypothetical predicted protein [Marmota monax]